MTMHMPGARKADPADLRRATRERVDFGTQATGGGGMYPVQVVNISALGMMARTDAVLAKGDRLIVELPHVRRVEAVVRWVEDGRIGTEFITPLATDDFALMMITMPRRQTAW